MKNLRNYQTYTILRSVGDPVMFLGLPLRLALIYLGTFVVCAMIALFLGNTSLSVFVKIGLPVGLCFGAIVLIRAFYKKYGINGFYLQRRDGSLPNEIAADKSIITILKEKNRW